MLIEVFFCPVFHCHKNNVVTTNKDDYVVKYSPFKHKHHKHIKNYLQIDIINSLIIRYDCFSSFPRKSKDTVSMAYLVHKRQGRKKNLIDFFCFVTFYDFLLLFIFEDWCKWTFKKVIRKKNRIRIRKSVVRILTEMPRIQVSTPPPPSSRIHGGSDPPDWPGAQGAESALQRGTPPRQDQGWRIQLLHAYLRVLNLLEGFLS